MIDYPDDPLRSTFAPSIVAAYRCASRFIRMICGSYEVRKDMLARVWHIWAQCVSCSVNHELLLDDTELRMSI